MMIRQISLSAAILAAMLLTAGCSSDDSNAFQSATLGMFDKIEFNDVKGLDYPLFLGLKF